MSIQCINKVWKNSRAKGDHLVVMLALADQAGSTGTAWVKPNYLATRCRVTPNELELILNNLERLGEIARQESRITILAAVEGLDE